MPAVEPLASTSPQRPDRPTWLRIAPHDVTEDSRYRGRAGDVAERQVEVRSSAPGPRQRLPVSSSRLIGALLIGAVGCKSQAEPARLEVYAASSLTEAFQALEAAFEAAHPGVDVELSFAGSQVLRLQIERGAPADVIATANQEHMDALKEKGLVDAPRIFAMNELVAIAPLAHPTDLETFEDLRRVERIVLGTTSVPVGRYARKAIAAAAEELGADFREEVLARVVSEETNVRLVRAKVELGEADAALVYRTDAFVASPPEAKDTKKGSTSAPQVRVVPIPARWNVRAQYPMAVVARTERRPDADAWMRFVLSEEGQAILARHGFIVEE